MSAGGNSGGSKSQDFELNLAPIIDCFTVLVTFLLASSTFLTIGIIDAGISAGDAGATDNTPPPIQITVTMQRDHHIRIKTEGKLKQTIVIPNHGTTWGKEDLSKHLQDLKVKFPTVTGLTLSPDDEIAYGEIIDVMEVARKTQPAVLLGGP